MKVYLFVFCIWIWVLSLLYLKNVTLFSTLYLTFFALLFTMYHSILYKKNKRPLVYKIGIICFEMAFFTVVCYKHFMIDKRKAVELTTMGISLVVFLVYLLFLKVVLNRTFYQYYFIDII